MSFHLQSPHRPKGDQPKAIAELSEGLARGDKFQVLLGATGKHYGDLINGRTSRPNSRSLRPSALF